MRQAKVKNLLSKKEPEKGLVSALNRTGGRNSDGRLTVRHRGGGVKRLYRIVDFGQEKLNIPGKVIALEYDPNRTSFIALIQYQDGDKRYILASQGLKPEDEIICADKTEIRLGNRLKLKYVSPGTQVYNVELEANRGGKTVRGAGGAAIVLAIEDNFCQLEMPSKEVRKVSGECFASIGQVSHAEKKFEILGKAGRKRLKGWRPRVRGTVMNPCDHPHGGGEGRTGAGMRYPKTPWGKHAMGVKTRKKKWTDKLIIKRRNK